MVFGSPLTLGTFVLVVVVARFNSWDYFFFTFKKGSGYGYACGSWNVKTYSYATCYVTVMHDKSAVGLVEKN